MMTPGSPLLVVRDGGRGRALFRAFFQSRGMPQQNHSANERIDPIYVAFTANLKHLFYVGTC
jgi:hypothetical protein